MSARARRSWDLAREDLLLVCSTVAVVMVKLLVPWRCWPGGASKIHRYGEVGTPPRRVHVVE